jgi:hypothetical protein
MTTKYSGYYQPPMTGQLPLPPFQQPMMGQPPHFQQPMMGQPPHFQQPMPGQQQMIQQKEKKIRVKREKMVTKPLVGADGSISMQTVKVQRQSATVKEMEVLTLRLKNELQRKKMYLKRIGCVERQLQRSQLMLNHQLQQHIELMKVKSCLEPCYVESLLKKLYDYHNQYLSMIGDEIKAILPSIMTDGKIVEMLRSQGKDVQQLNMIREQRDKILNTTWKQYLQQKIQSDEQAERLLEESSWLSLQWEVHLDYTQHIFQCCCTVVTADEERKKLNLSELHQALELCWVEWTTLKQLVKLLENSCIKLLVEL